MDYNKVEDAVMKKAMEIFQQSAVREEYDRYNEKKLLQMKQLVKKDKQGNLTARELEELNAKINNLVAQVRAIDSESRKTEHQIILE